MGVLAMVVLVPVGLLVAWVALLISPQLFLIGLASFLVCLVVGAIKDAGIGRD